MTTNTSSMPDIILELANENPVNPAKLHHFIKNMNTVDIAYAFELLSREKTIQVFRLLPKKISADVFSYIDPEKQQIIIEALTDSEIGKIIDALFIDDAVDFIEEMPANVVKRVLMSVNEEKRQVINQLLQYPDDSAGSIMTTEYVDLAEDAVVSEAFDVIRTTGVNKETIYTCYVIRRDRLLVGAVSAKTLMLAKQQDRIGDIMDTNFIFASTTDDQEKIASMFAKYRLLSMPIVDKEQRLVGIVTIDDIVQIIEDEATEDIEKMAAIIPSEESYLKNSVIKHTRNRIFWLMVLMLSATITASIIEGFENSLAVLPILVAFIPMLMDTGGNAGAQASALIIRGMALGEIQFRNIVKVLWCEIRVGVLCGIILGAVNFIRIYLMNGRDYKLCITVTCALIATVVIAKSIGCLLPLFAKKIKIDPAVLSAPISTTVADASSLIIYFTLARAILKI
jgi:magnesium transporter